MPKKPKKLEIFRGILFVFTGTLSFFIIFYVVANLGNFSKVYAASAQDIKKHLRTNNDDQTLNNIPYHGQDSFGRFLWGLAGCESTWNDKAVGGGGLFYGLYQFSTGTWESINRMKGTPNADIFDGIAQIDATVYMLQNASKTGGFNNWPACTDGISKLGNKEWSDFVDDWPGPPLGDIIVTPAITAEQAPNLEIWLSGKSPKSASVVDSTVFSGLTPVVYEVHVRTSGPGVDSNYSIQSSLYTLCDSGQEGCVRSRCNPLHGSCPISFTEDAYGKYHVWDAQRWVKSVSQHEIVVDVNVPPEGFVDLMFYLCPSAAGQKSCYPYGYFGKNNSAQPLAFFVRDAYAAERSPLPPPKPFDPPVSNLPVCSDSIYGGYAIGDPANIKVRFITYNATKVEYEVYENGNLFYNSLQGQGYWQNLNTASAYSLYVDHWYLSPGSTYTWRVRSGNETRWSPWKWGNFWTVPDCSNPPNPPKNLTVSKPSCTDPPNTFNATFNWSTNGGSPTKTEYDLTGTKVLFQESRNSVVTAKTISNIPLENWNDTFRVRFGNVGLDGQTDWSGWTTLTFEMPVCTQPDLLISQLATDNTDYAHGAAVNVTIKIKNNSTGTLPTQIWTWYGSDTETRDMNNMPICKYDAAYSNQQAPAAWYQGSMSRGQEITFSHSFNAPQTPGTYKIKAVVDGYCLVDENDDSGGGLGGGGTMGANNIKQITFNVKDWDSDGDGFTYKQEIYMGTDPNKKCPTTATANDESPDAWTPDFNDDRKVNTIDVLFFGGKTGKKVADNPSLKRYDFDANGTINIIDVQYMSPYMGKSCTP